MSKFRKGQIVRVKSNGVVSEILAIGIDGMIFLCLLSRWFNAYELELIYDPYEIEPSGEWLSDLIKEYCITRNDDSDECATCALNKASGICMNDREIKHGLKSGILKLQGGIPKILTDWKAEQEKAKVDDAKEIPCLIINVNESCHICGAKLKHIELLKG